jgi:hypothetical protein
LGLTPLALHSSGPVLYSALAVDLRFLAARHVRQQAGSSGRCSSRADSSSTSAQVMATRSEASHGCQRAAVAQALSAIAAAATDAVPCSRKPGAVGFG